MTRGTFAVSNRLVSALQLFLLQRLDGILLHPIWLEDYSRLLHF